MDGKRLIEKIRLRNILSFGDKGEEITLEPLNIIIGQNASGKSNLVDVIKLLRSLPQEKGLVNFISKNGGIGEWIWKGKQDSKTAEIEVLFEGIEINLAKLTLKNSIKYSINIKESNFRSEIEEEKIEEAEMRFVDSESLVWFYRYVDNKAELARRVYKKNPSIESRLEASIEETGFKTGSRYELEEVRLSSNESILSQIRDHFYHPQISYLGEVLREARIYTDISVNRPSSKIRSPQITDGINDFLDEDALNLFLVLNSLELKGGTKALILEYLKKFVPSFQDYLFNILGGTVQLFIREEGLEKPISAMRLSDGTLRYLCLLAILCHPEPPPLICIEEPETGLHPDILPTIAELMIEASQRTQLIVTTHSDILVSAFSEIPEAVLVCEKDEDGTHFRRLEAEKLKVWLEEYSLGEVWLRGGIGGTRW